MAHKTAEAVRVSASLVECFVIKFCRKHGFGDKAACTDSFPAASKTFQLAVAVATATSDVASSIKARA